MSRLAAYFRSSRSPSASRDEALAFTNQQAVQLTDAFSKVSVLMNGNADKAWELLQGTDGTKASDKLSPTSSSHDTFHLYASSLVIFFRAIMGFEKSIMTEAQAIFAQTETQATADLKKAQKLSGPNSCGGRSGVYAAGVEYELIRAEVQLMAAVVGVLHESLMEAMLGFNKVRKAYIALSAIIDAEKKALKKVGEGAVVSNGSEISVGKLAISEDKKREEGKDEAGDAFVDAKETISETQTPADSSSTTPNGSEINLPSTPVVLDENEYDTSSLTHPVDIFIHSGANLCFGFLIFALTIIPPSFSKILSVVGFHGNRAAGLSMVWRAAAISSIPRASPVPSENSGDETNGQKTEEKDQANVHAALAAMALFMYYSVMLSTVDIIPPPSEPLDDTLSQAVGRPKEKLDALLKDLRTRYPDSQQWVIEEARRKSLEKNASEAIAMLNAPALVSDTARQISAMRYFELTLIAMVAQQWDTMRTAALRSMELNEWSPCVYLYLSGAASLELYRNAHFAGDVDTARREKEKCEKLFREAPTRSGKKKFFAKQLPIEVFMNARVAKWEARLAKWQDEGLDATLADAVGVSPAYEFSHIWNGGKRMAVNELEGAVKCLEWDRLTAPKKEDIEQDKAEQAMRGLILGATLRWLGKVNEGRQSLEAVLKHEP